MIKKIMGYKVKISRAISYLNYVNTGLLAFLTLKDTTLFSGLNQYVLLFGIGSILLGILLFIGWLEDVLGFHSAELEYNTDRNKRFIDIEQRLKKIQNILEDRNDK